MNQEQYTYIFPTHKLFNELYKGAKDITALLVDDIPLPKGYTKFFMNYSEALNKNVVLVCK